MGCFQSSEKEILDEDAKVDPLDDQEWPRPAVPRGSRVYIYKQDPSLKAPGYRQLWLPLDIRPGPHSDDITVRGLMKGRIYPSDRFNNYLYEPTIWPEDFDGVNTFATVFLILNMYRRALRRMGSRQELTWQWGSRAINVYPRAGNEMNAYYTRTERSLLFFYFMDDFTGSTVYLCRSFDVISHETGHAILDSLKPSLIESTSAYCGALHESFGDLTSILGLLYQMDMCEAVIAHSNGDLHNKSFFPLLAEEFGDALGRQYGLRNADNNLAIDDVTDEVHDLSRVFTGAVYDILVDMYEMTRNLAKYNPAETLYRVGQHVCSVLVMSLLQAPRECDFKDVARRMISLEPQQAFKTVITRHFDKRKIFSTFAKPRPVTIRTFLGVCGTMKAQADPKIQAHLHEVCMASPENVVLESMNDSNNVNVITQSTIKE